MIIKSEDTGDTLLPSEEYLRKYAIRLAKESVARNIKQMDSMDD